MSRKINTTTKIVLILTILLSIILVIYISAMYIIRLPPSEHELPVLLTYIAGLGIALVAGGFGPFICIIAVIGGLAGIFGKKITFIDRIICIPCTLLCFIFFICMSFPVGYSSERGRRISCSSNLKQISLALRQYATDYASHYPPANGAAGLETLRKNDYLTDYAAFTCPSTTTARSKDGQPLVEESVDYVYIGGLNAKSDPNLPLLYDKTDNHRHFGNVLFVDGTIKGIKGDPWTQSIKK